MGDHTPAFAVGKVGNGKTRAVGRVGAILGVWAGAAACGAWESKIR
jgi:hypothetical protein